MDSYEYLVSPLKPDANARFSELENLLERKRGISAYKPVYGENRDVYCNRRFLSGNAAVAVYDRSRLQPVEGYMFRYSVSGNPLDAVSAVVMPSTAGLNV